MARQRKHLMHYPEGADQRLLKRLHTKALAAREKDIKQEHGAFLQRAKLRADLSATIKGSVAIDTKRVVDAWRGKRQRTRELYARPRGRGFKPLKGHNPARYAPFDVSWQYQQCGSIVLCNLYGPQASSGEIGADLLSIGGLTGATAASAVGFWYFAQQYTELLVTAQVLMWAARGYIASILGGFGLGHAEAYASLRLYVKEYSAAGPAYSSTVELYNHASGFWPDFNLNVMDDQTRTVDIAIPVQPGTWYLIWIEAIQHVFAAEPLLDDALSNFQMYVGPVSYSEYTFRE